MAPYFSILIPLYNKERHVTDTLKSVLAQTFTDFEVIIADDGSTDSSAAIVKSFDDKRIKYYLKPNEGVSATRNFAIHKATGKYFAFLDADDTWHPNHLELIAQAIHKFPHLNVFTTLIEAENSKGIYMPVYTNLSKEIFQETDYFMASLARSVLSGSTTVVHKSVPKTIGIFNTSLTTFEDIDYWIRIGLQYKIGVVNKVTARHVYVPESLSHKKFRMEDATYFEKYRASENENPVIKKMIDQNRYSLALRCKMAGDDKAYRKLMFMIAAKSLTLQQRIIVTLPGGLLRLLQKLKQYAKAKL